jgi:hypothetical protein
VKTKKNLAFLKFLLFISKNMQRKKRSAINTKNLKKYLKKADHVVYGFDHLKLQLQDTIQSLDHILYMLNDRNTNYSIEDIVHNDQLYNVNFTCISKKTGKTLWSNAGKIIQILVSIDNIPYTIAQYIQYHDSYIEFLKNTSSGSLEIYGTYLQLVQIKKINMDFILDILKGIQSDQEDIQTFKKGIIYEADYKIDFCFYDDHVVFKKEDFLEIRGNQKNKYLWDIEDAITKDKGTIQLLDKDLKYTQFSVWNEVTGWSVGNRKAWYIYMRCYNKNLDTEEKSKWHLYNDYRQYKMVVRFEMECKRKFCRARENYTFDQLDMVEKQCLEWMGLEEKTGNFKTDFGQATSFEYYDQDKKRKYIKTALWYIKSIILDNISFISIMVDYIMEIDFLSTKDKLQIAEKQVQGWQRRIKEIKASIARQEKMEKKTKDSIK